MNENIVYTKGSTNCWDTFTSWNITNCPNIGDNNSNTFAYIDPSGGLDTDEYAYFEGHLDKARYVTKATYIYEISLMGDNCSVAVTPQLWGGSWITLDTFNYEDETAKLTKNYTVGWPNITYARLKVRIMRLAPQSVVFRCYEVQTWADVYLDSGLRIKKSGATLKLGCEILGSHKLRVRKPGVTRGIPLVGTGNVNASPVRIYDGTSIKALPLSTE